MTCTRIANQSHMTRTRIANQSQTAEELNKKPRSSKCVQRHQAVPGPWLCLEMPSRRLPPSGAPVHPHCPQCGTPAQLPGVSRGRGRRKPDALTGPDGAPGGRCLPTDLTKPCSELPSCLGPSLSPDLLEQFTVTPASPGHPTPHSTPSTPSHSFQMMHSPPRPIAGPPSPLLPTPLPLLDAGFSSSPDL